MLRKLRGLWILVLGISFLLSSCKEGTKDQSEDMPLTAEAEVTQTTEEPQPSQNDTYKVATNSDKPETIVDFSDEWTRLYSVHESAINNYEGMPLMELPMSAMPLANSIFYTMLDLDNSDGNFSGIIGFGEDEGYYNKSGSKVTFGQDSIRQEDGFTFEQKAGDQILTEGVFDADLGYLKYENVINRGGVPITTTFAEYQKMADGGLITMYVVMKNFNNNGEAEKMNSLVFITMSETQYEFVIANGNQDLDVNNLELSENMTTEEAEKLFNETGCNITHKGGVIEGKFVVDQP